MEGNNKRSGNPRVDKRVQNPTLGNTVLSLNSHSTESQQRTKHGCDKRGRKHDRNGCDSKINHISGEVISNIFTREKKENCQYRQIIQGLIEIFEWLMQMRGPGGEAPRKMLGDYALQTLGKH